jgi:hypothetical protein
MFLNIFNHFLGTYLSIFFEKKQINNDKILNILKKRIFLFKNKKIIFFLPYKNILVKKSIWQLKFYGGTNEAKFFGKIIYDYLPEILNELKISENFNEPILLTIPLN